MNFIKCRLTDQHAFDGSDSDMVLLENANSDRFDDRLRSALLRVMPRQPAVIRRKHKPPIVVENGNVLTIFTSDLEPPRDKALQRRCFKVWAKEKACRDGRDDDPDVPGENVANYINPKLLDGEPWAAREPRGQYRPAWTGCSRLGDEEIESTTNGQSKYLVICSVVCTCDTDVFPYYHLHNR